MSKQKVSIIGVSGYTGIELLKILLQHPEANIQHLVSRSYEAGTKISGIYPHLKGITDLKISDAGWNKIAEDSDVVFLALPHLESQKIVPELVGKTKIIDLGADFRMVNVELFEKYYFAKHQCAEINKQFIYGLPEMNKEQVVGASCVANPGCFATVIQLMLLPVKGLVESVEVQAVTGSTGSGKTPSDGTHHPVRSHNMASYKIGKHQHLAEITENLGMDEAAIYFVPTSGPFSRGIFATAFVKLKNKIGSDEVSKIYSDFYDDKTFVRLQEKVELAQVVGSNFCDLSIEMCGDLLVVQGAIDNLVKGAAGQAVQNFNLMFDYAEGTALTNLIPLYP